MMRVIYLPAVITLLLLSTVAAAQEKIYRNKFNTCSPTKQVVNNYEPEVFGTTNNLLHAPGAVEAFCGQQIIITGTVLDADCVPVSDAKVYLWQAGCDGKYPYKPLRNVAHKHLINLHSQSSFQGSGTATTDNNGRFTFITIYPEPVHKTTQPINIRVEHLEIGTLQTHFVPKQAGCGCAQDDAYDTTIVMHKASQHKRY